MLNKIAVTLTVPWLFVLGVSVLAISCTPASGCSVVVEECPDWFKLIGC